MTDFINCIIMTAITIFRIWSTKPNIPAKLNENINISSFKIYRYSARNISPLSAATARFHFSLYPGN